MQYRPPNAYQQVSNTNHFGSVSYILDRLVAAKQCMASDTDRKSDLKTIYCLTVFTDVCELRS